MTPYIKTSGDAFASLTPAGIVPILAALIGDEPQRMCLVAETRGGANGETG